MQRATQDRRGLLVRRLLVVALLAILCASAARAVAESDDSPAPADSASSTDTSKPASALPMDPQAAVKSGGDALRSDDRFPWYDAKNDKLQPVVLVRVRGKFKGDMKKDSHGHFDGHGSGDDGSSGGDSNSDSNDGSSSPNFSMPDVSAPWLIWVVWLVIGGVLVFLAVMLIKAFLDREARNSKSSDEFSSEPEEDDSRLDALPVPKAMPKSGLLEEARRCYEAGDYNTAIVYLYGYELLRLDQNQLIRLARGKTNRQYLRELSGRGELQSVLARTIVPFEDAYFGNHPLERARFEACWNDVARFDRLVEGGAT